MKSWKKWVLTIAAWSPILPLGIFAFSRCAIVSGVEHQQATEISTFIESVFGESLDYFARPQPMRTDLVVYGVLDAVEQTDLIKIVKDRIQVEQWNPILISFYKARIRIVTEYPNGASLSVRGPEELLRQVKVSRPTWWW